MPEHLLWLELRDRRLGGHKFRRQTPIGHRIADFFCPAKALIVEVDGHTHDREHDLIRDAALEGEAGFHTVRFTNGDVMTNMEGVKLALLRVLEARPDRWNRSDSTTPQPPPLKRRGSHKRKAPSSSEEGVGRGVFSSDRTRA